MKWNEEGQISESHPSYLMSFDWSNPFQSAGENISSGFKDTRFLDPLGVGQALGFNANKNDGEGGSGFVGYVPQHAGELDQILADLISGKSGGMSNPFLSDLQKNARQNIRSAQADRGTFNAGFSAPLEARYLTDIYASQQNQQINDLLSYLGIARPQPLAAQPGSAPGAGDFLAQGVGQSLPFLLNLLMG